LFKPTCLLPDRHGPHVNPALDYLFGEREQ
jgi:hypothetical protein